MNKKILFPLFVSIITILFFNHIYFHLIDLNFSWTFSKLFPYILLAFSGILFFIFLKELIKNKIISYSLRGVFLVLPFVLGFILHPIYQGDFSNNSVIPSKKINDFEKINNGLSVISIAGCPFCLESINKLKLIKKRNPNINIDFIVCTENINYLKEYQKVSGKSVHVRLAQNSDSLAGLVGWTFPTFIEKKEGNLKYQWSNDDFGVGALDQLENDFK